MTREEAKEILTKALGDLYSYESKEFADRAMKLMKERYP